MNSFPPMDIRDRAVRQSLHRYFRCFSVGFILLGMWGCSDTAHDTHDGASSTDAVSSVDVQSEGLTDAQRMGTGSPDAQSANAHNDTQNSEILESDTPAQSWENGEFYDLGMHAHPDGSTDTLSFTAPEDIVSFAITVHGEHGVTYAIHDLIAPDGAILAAPDWPLDPNSATGSSMCVECANRIASAEDAHACLVPITPAATTMPGTYTFKVMALEVLSDGMFSAPTLNPLDGEVWIGVNLKTHEDGLPETGYLNLNLHFTGADDITAETAPSDPLIVEALEIFESVYAQVGISLGEVTYRDIDPAYQVVDGMVGVGNDFVAAAALTEGAPPGVNLIFVREIIDSSLPLGGFGAILGVSGGIPGPMGIQGTGRSAVIVATSIPEQAGDTSVGLTMAHEVGHFLGLFHASEIPFFNLHDPLPDTAENDSTNLMYFEASNGGTTLSEQQGAVIRSNLWVMHAEENP